MKVISESFDNPNIPIMQVTCTGQGFISTEGHGCGCLLEVTPMDVCNGVHHDYAGGSDRYYYIVCPVCGHKTEVFYSQMSQAFRNLI